MWMRYLLINTGTVPDLGVLFFARVDKDYRQISVNGNNTATMERVS